ncbi:MAG: hypothetical protein JWP12_696 [Bacteroidetes bacterium]|nr:hypothetical protein [Bacteroidota bacterium]
MKKLIAILFPILLLQVAAKAQIQHVIVEKYYVSDSLDNTDTIDGAARALPVGSKTYRVYVQLDAGYRLKKMYGTANHPLKIKSTANFFNNIDRPTAYFGYLINKAWFSGNPTLALDSWLTLGLCATNYNGVLKTDDTDGSVILPSWGGTASVPGGILRNNDTAAGIPITTEDGMKPKTGTFTTWINNGFIDSPTGTEDTTVFGSVNTGSQFISTTAFLQQNSGVIGDSLTGEKVLVAQLTTTGEISFELNLQLITPGGASMNIVPGNNSLPTTGDTTVNGMLKYPPDAPVCGCKDPNYLEYNAAYACSDPFSCIHLVVLGCMDTLACNYDPAVNFHIQSLCCYPGNCNNRDIALVCPGIATEAGVQLYPNPATEGITIQFSAGEYIETKYAIFDSYGTVVLQRDLGMRTGNVVENVDISNLQTGLYLLKVFKGNNNVESKTFMKQ